MHATINYLSIVLCLGLSACASQSLAPSHSLTQLPVSYSKPSSESLQKIKIERVSLTDEQLRELAALPKTTAEFGSRWLVEQRPDTMRPGPWTTRLYIFDATAGHQCVRLELTDHASYDVQRTWLNDKMLFVRVSWVASSARTSCSTLRPSDLHTRRTPTISGWFIRRKRVVRDDAPAA